MVKRRDMLLGVVGVVTISLAGCVRNEIGSDPSSDAEEEEDEPVSRSDKGIVVEELGVFSEGDRHCYHDYEATVINENDFDVQEVRIDFVIYNESGQVLSEFETGYRSMDAGESLELVIEHGPQKNECWADSAAEDYDIDVSYNREGE